MTKAERDRLRASADDNGTDPWVCKSSMPEVLDSLDAAEAEIERLRGGVSVASKQSFTCRQCGTFVAGPLPCCGD